MSISVEQSQAQALHSENTRCIIVDADPEKKLDRSNIGLAKITGMKEDLHLTSHQYYTAVIHDSLSGSPIGFLTRFLLGVFEAGFSVGTRMIFESNSNFNEASRDLLDFYMVLKERAECFWHNLELSLTRSRSKRFIIFLTAGLLSGAFGGVISPAVTSTLDGYTVSAAGGGSSLSKGVTTTGVSIIVHWTLLDYPHSSRGLSPEERKLAQQRLIEDGNADQGDSKNQNTSIFILLLQAIPNWRTWIPIPGYMAILGASAISYFYPTLVNDMGYTATAAQYMTAPLYIVSLAAAIPICWFADPKPHARGQLLVGSMIVVMVFFAFTAGIRNSTAQYIALALSFTTTALASVTRNVRTIMLAWMSGVAALAQLYGSALFPAEDSPAHVVEFSVFAATFAIGLFVWPCGCFVQALPMKGKMIRCTIFDDIELEPLGFAMIYQEEM
ncbi:Major facilitator superfamily domain general substrate transporter [Penicillium cf. griseofulvum]|uniref:Major facilitator superfamily domain general substrate transporter n=1 Tax=Penicillium cf. griseofulvum TaxID=2972120 RepID=A0A9W9JPU8_9EURO|nr:Major facilitator superfamily domain general substrate transporter [Penicillium cf. griseofulvum]